MTDGDRSPHISVSGVVRGSFVQAGTITGEVTFFAGRPYRLEPQHPGTTARGNRRPGPSYLLDAQWEIVPFRPRPAEERRLRAWRDGPGELSALLVHGPGGHGKTRLADRFAAESHHAATASSAPTRWSTPATRARY